VNFLRGSPAYQQRSLKSTKRRMAVKSAVAGNQDGGYFPRAQRD
jgi:hypothetical protein